MICSMQRKTVVRSANPAHASPESSSASKESAQITLATVLEARQAIGRCAGLSVVVASELSWNCFVVAGNETQPHEQLQEVLNLAWICAKI